MNDNLKFYGTLWQQHLENPAACVETVNFLCEMPLSHFAYTDAVKDVDDFPSNKLDKQRNY